jgi:hypothetical protein
MKITLLLLIIYLFPIYSYGSEQEIRDTIQTEVRLNLNRSNFSELEALHAKYIRDERTPSGKSYLALYYEAIKASFKKERDPNYWEKLDEKATNWQKLYPKSSAAVIFKSIILWKHATTMRGAGQEQMVNPDDQLLVEKYAQDTIDYLYAHKEISTVDPEWYVVAIDAIPYTTNSKLTISKLFEEAILKYPDYNDIYKTTIFYSVPKWGGSYEFIDAVAHKAVEVTKIKQGMSNYARIYWYLDSIDTKGRIFDKSKAQWGLMKNGFDDIVKLYPDPWNINTYAYFACMANDYTKMKELLLRLNGAISFDAWGQWKKATYDGCIRKQTEMGRHN